MYGDDRRRTTGNDLVTQMLRLPMAAYFYSLEWLIRTVQATQSCIQASSATQPSQLTQEGRAMDNDQDLSGDDLKFVSYAILFTKRDLEATLETCQEELISYSTNGGSYGGLKIAKFMAKVMEGKVRKPQAWIDNGYPDGKNEYGWTIPDEDERYVTFLYKVERRLDRQNAHYDRDQTKALKEINSTLSGISAKMG